MSRLDIEITACERALEIQITDEGKRQTKNRLWMLYDLRYQAEALAKDEDCQIVVNGNKDTWWKDAEEKWDLVIDHAMEVNRAKFQDKLCDKIAESPLVTEVQLPE